MTWTVFSTIELPIIRQSFWTGPPGLNPRRLSIATIFILIVIRWALGIWMIRASLPVLIEVSMVLLNMNRRRTKKRWLESRENWRKKKIYILWDLFNYCIDNKYCLCVSWWLIWRKSSNELLLHINSLYEFSYSIRIAGRAHDNKSSGIHKNLCYI